MTLHATAQLLVLLYFHLSERIFPTSVFQKMNILKSLVPSAFVMNSPKNDP